MPPAPAGPSRRQLFAFAAALGVGPAAFQRALAAQPVPAAAHAAVTPDMVRDAEWVAGITLSDADRKKVADGLTRYLADFAALHQIEVGNGVPPATHFVPDPTPSSPTAGRGSVTPTKPAAPVTKPAADDDLAFLPLTALAELVRTKQVSSVELTKLYLARLERFDPLLKCVVTLTPEVALKQAAAADREIAAGNYRGPLHGVPWGAKDLIAYPGYKTTWGAGRFKDQTLPDTAAVAAKLDAAGAVLVAKLTLGALALGDQWFGGMTRNPWNPKQGSSGSSAGSAAAAAAGLVGFAVGSETYGSIVSPCTRCGATGLRPTFGRVSRAGCMTLSWSMDKLGPIARGVEDCALVLGAVHGADPADPAAVTRPFDWPAKRPLSELRVGYFEADHPGATSDDTKRVLAGLGVKLVPLRLPQAIPEEALQFILMAEASAAFDEFLVRGDLGDVGAYWPAAFKKARFVPAVEYLRAQRVRTKLMREMAAAVEGVDCYVGGDDLLLTNLTGHPTVCLPNGFTMAGGVEVPTAVTFTGRLWGEGALLAVAKAYQNETGHHRKRPPLAGA